MFHFISAGSSSHSAHPRVRATFFISIICLAAAMVCLAPSHSHSAEKKTKQETAAKSKPQVPTPAEILLQYDKGQEEVRNKYSGALGKQATPYFIEKQPKPVKALAIAANDDLRALPYPYSAAMAVCYNEPAMTFGPMVEYQLASSRKYGLDTPFVFYPYNPAYFQKNLAFFGGGQRQPLLQAIEFDDDLIAAMPLFMATYYRGWLGGINGWSRIPDSGSIIEPLKVAAGQKPTARKLKVNKLPGTAWAGMRINFTPSTGVEAFELSLTDSNGLKHYVVYNVPLGDRQGWELSAVSPDELNSACLFLGSEKNRKYLRALGYSSNKNALKDAAISVQGDPGAYVSIESVKLVYASHKLIAKQMNTMSSYNLLPAADLNLDPSTLTETCCADIQQQSQQLKKFGIAFALNKQGQAGPFFQPEFKRSAKLPEKIEKGSQYLVELSGTAPVEAHEQQLKKLAAWKYGWRQTGQKLWLAPPAVAMRYQMAMAKLDGNYEIDDNAVEIDSDGNGWPDKRYPAQDLHGVTFYVQEASKARVMVDGKEISSLMRNQADASGRQSITIVDDSTPTTVFDEVSLNERNGRIFGDGASTFFQKANAYSGDYALEVRADQPGEGSVAWKPFLLDTHESNYLRFAYKKTNPASKVVIGWGSGDDLEFVATEGDLNGRQGWQIKHYQDTDYHEVVLDLAAMQPDAKGRITVPRVDVKSFFFGISGSKEGDAVFFDKVQFLAVRGVRPSANGTVVIGGRLTPNIDSEVVKLTYGDKIIETTTSQGGWYVFNNVPKGAVGSITHTKSDIVYFPARGLVFQADKNDMSYDIYAVDKRSPSVPRPEFKGAYTTKYRRSVQKAIGSVSPPVESLYYNRDNYAGHFAPHGRRIFVGPSPSTPPNQKPDKLIEFFADEQASNLGQLDIDRRFDNPDGALRIVLLGGCWLEGLQSTVDQHTNLFLETILRRKTGVNVEVIAQSGPNTTVGHNTGNYSKYGQRFKPDFVLAFITQVDTYLFDPDLTAQWLGMPKGHANRHTYGFDQDGNLYPIPADPNFRAHLTQKDKRPLEPGISKGATGFILKDWPQPLHRATQLLQATLAEVLKDKAQGAKLGIIFGYHANSAGSVGVSCKKDLCTSVQRWLNFMHTMCSDIGAYPLDLSGTMFRKNIIDWRSWKNNWHPSPYGHYMIAKSVADKLLAWPEFQAAVERARISQAKSSDQ